MSRRQTKVFLALAWHEPGHLLGISRYACEKDWQIVQSWSTTHNHMHPQLAQEIRDFQPHGIFSQLQRRNQDIVRVVQAARIPTVELCWGSGMDVPHVVPDEAAIGTLVARHLLDRGFTRFVYVGQSQSEQQRAFSQTVRAAGHEVRAVFIDEPKMTAELGPVTSFSPMVHDVRYSLPRAWARRFFSQCATPVGVYTESIGWATAIAEGCRAARYIEHLRIGEAATLLETTDSGVSSIAFHCGFDDALRFRRAFRRVKGMVPSQYRKQCVGALASASPGQQAGSVSVRVRPWAAADSGEPHPSFASGRRDRRKNKGSNRLVATLPKTPAIHAPGKAESKAESFSQRLLRVLASDPRCKQDLAHELGREKVDGQLNRAVNTLVADGLAERTIPDKPNSRLQQYRLTEKGRAHFPGG